MSIQMLRGNHFQAWRTPKRIFDVLSEEVGGYGLDLFADAENHLCPTYFTEQDDAIVCRWDCDKIAFGNPPYGGNFQEEAVMKAIVEVQRAKRLPGVDLLLQASVSSKWFALAFEHCEIHLFSGRIAFDTPADMANPKRPSFSNALIRVRPDGPHGVTAMRSAKTGQLLGAK